jgi:hypothetical protein
MGDPLDLASLFQSVTQNLIGNKDVLNQADTYNNNHGDNMVEIFRVITQAMELKQGASPSECIIRPKAHSDSGVSRTLIPEHVAQ